MHFRMSGSIHGLYPLGTRSTSPIMTIQVTPDVAMGLPRGHHCPQLKTCVANVFLSEKYDNREQEEKKKIGLWD